MRLFLRAAARVALVLAALLLVLLVLLMVFLEYLDALDPLVKSMDLSYYETLREYNDYLPALDELGDYADLVCSSWRYGDTKGCTLLVCYDSPESYAALKPRWEEMYRFQEESIIDHSAEGHGQDPVRETAFDLDGFALGLLNMKEYRLSYPKRMSFLGASEERAQLCVVHFSNQALDFTSGPLADLISKYCGWDAALAAAG